MAANPHKGEVEFKDAEGIKRKLQLTMDVAAILEEKYDETLQEIIQRLAAPRMTFVRDMFCAMLVGDCEDEAGLRIVGAMRPAEAFHLVIRAVKLATEDDELTGEDSPVNGVRPPQKAGRGEPAGGSSLPMVSPPESARPNSGA